MACPTTIQKRRASASGVKMSVPEAHAITMAAETKVHTKRLVPEPMFSSDQFLMIVARNSVDAAIKNRDA